MELNFQGLVIMILSICSTIIFCIYCVVKLIKKK